ncbi:MAG: PAS domain S-box protein [Ignavibacteriae bacterium]|nr:PAS domain S-box protein [Ignavibacteriota bacterium]NOG96372.1 PAS domain S-box protein [Ignavibacteriota bacterium]
MPLQSTWKDFFIRIILPTLLAFVLFTLTIFTIIIPSFEDTILERKREMIKELTNSAWSVLAEFEQHEQEGKLSKEEAQKEALTRIEYLRYGNERKDYFWITDMHPNMIMHPYRKELDGTDLSDYKDPEGKRLFVELAKVVSDNGEGYVDYMWQWKDDSTKIVPKLSYVKGFKQWGWIIGTGIYVEDVAEETAQLKKRLFYISLAILLLLGVILSYIATQSLKIERKKQEAEKGLRESEAKYRALVEASTEGLVMFLDGEYVYANNIIYHLLDYSSEDIENISIKNILCGSDENKSSGEKYFYELLRGKLPDTQIEAQLKTKSGKSIDVLLFASEINFADKSGYTIIVKDLSSQKIITGELDETKEKFNRLTNIVSIGVFRTTLGRKGKFIEANEAVLKLLGYKSKEALYGVNIFDLFHNSEDRKSFVKNLMENESIKNAVVQITRGDGISSIISVSAVLVNDETGSQIYCDGIIDDITERIKLSEERENLIAELQTSLYFLNHPIQYYAKEIVSCNMNLPIYQAAELMTKKKYSAILVTADSGEYVGIITDRDLRERVVAGNYDLQKPVFEVMTSPLLSINSNALIFEALLKMHNKSTRHLAVRDNNGKIQATISSEELLQIQRGSTSFLIREINNSDSTEDIIESYERLPRIVKTLVESGAKAKNITRIISSVSDAIIKRLVELTIKEIGEPPVPFSFITFGSVGREEQTLITDQDNAIIYAADENKSAKLYFTKLGEQVCNQLNEAGYSFCEGDNMAKNPEWVQSIDTWKNNFSNWIINSTPDDLLRLGIFFDFRSVYGDDKFANQLREHIFKVTEHKAAFFQHLTMNCLEHKPPVGLLGKIVVKSSGEHPETFDIKKAMMPVVDFARIYSLRHSVSDTNTLDRFHSLFEKNILNRNTYLEMIHAYNFLMQLRIKHQVLAISKNSEPNNFVNPEQLTQIEQNTLKNTFSQIASIQKKLSYDFTGDAL